MSKKDSLVIKSIAIILVILGHGNMIYGAGFLGVTLFLFVSGYGLNKAANQRIGAYIAKHILQLMTPYWGFILFQLLFETIYHGFLPWQIYLFSLIGLDFGYNIDPSMWYISYIVFCYLLFIPFKYLQRKSKAWSSIFLFIITIALLALSFSRILWPAQRASHVYFLSFPLGLLFSQFNFNFQKINYVKYLYILFCFLCVLYVAVSHRIQLAGIYLLLYTYWVSACIILFPFVFKTDSLLWKINPKYLIGFYSYSMYLIEGFLFRNHRILFIPDEKSILCIFVFLISVFVGVLYFYILNYFQKRMRHDCFKKN